MSDLRKAAQQALEALNLASRNGSDGLKRYEIKELDDTIAALHAALAQPEPEPVVWMSPVSQHMVGKDDGMGSAYHIITTSKATGNSTIPLYTAPPQRKPLTEEEIYKLFGWYAVPFVRAIEKAHGIGGEK